jgi:3'(2'), 5'-bisphosphate nucleotidase
MTGTGELLDELIPIARAAGDAVLAVYERGCVAGTKTDGSPVTEADHRSQEIICAGLGRLSPNTPIVAEEGAESERRAESDREFWLVDPLDGTKEFLAHSDEFTVNVALVRDGDPVLGVVLAPALGCLYAASDGRAMVYDSSGRREVSARAAPAEGATIVSSRSHGNPEALARFVGGRRIAASRTAGSSLKFCLVAVGEADIYPRFGRTMEWDTAAGDAIVRAAGGRVVDLEGNPLRYGKPGFENPHFIATGRDGDQ